MTYSLSWMADVLRAAGQRVIETSGWTSRGRGEMSTVTGVLGHHTATPASAVGNYPSLSVVTNGRSDLAGPLCNLGLGRDGTWYAVAAGRANHAGVGTLPWALSSTGNEHLIGIEAEYAGTGPWPDAILTAYPRGVRALLDHLGLPASRFAGHLEYAPTRKVDPANWPGGMDGFRSTVSTVDSPVGTLALEEEMIVACELNGAGKGTTYAVLSGGVLLGLAASSSAAKWPNILWVSPGDWAAMDTNSKHLLAQ